MRGSGSSPWTLLRLIQAPESRPPAAPVWVDRGSTKRDTVGFTCETCHLLQRLRDSPAAGQLATGLEGGRCVRRGVPGRLWDTRLTLGPCRALPSASPAPSEWPGEGVDRVPVSSNLRGRPPTRASLPVRPSTRPSTTFSRRSCSAPSCASLPCQEHRGPCCRALPDMAQPRDVTNHVLFEVATEVANKGRACPSQARVLPERDLAWVLSLRAC